MYFLFEDLSLSDLSGSCSYERGEMTQLRHPPFWETWRDAIDRYKARFVRHLSFYGCWICIQRPCYSLESWETLQQIHKLIIKVQGFLRQCFTDKP